MKTTQRTAPAKRRFRLTALLTAAAFVLAACGAQVSSELEITSDESGTRTLVATLVEEDLEHLSGGVEAAEAAIENHLPDALNFSGISPADQTEEAEEADTAVEDGSYLAVFELEFSDIDDYRTKAQSLIDVAVEKEQALRDSSEGEVFHKTVELNFEQNEGPLLDGVILDENFTGSELLEWVGYALVEDGVVDEEHSNNIIGSSSGESRIVIGGQEYETYEPFSVSEGTDHRFSTVNVRILETGAEVDFAAAFIMGDYDTGFALAEEYLNGTGVGTVTNTDDGYWTVALDDSAPLAEQLSTLLSMENLEIQVDETANAETATLVTTMTGTGFSCASICQQTPNISVDWNSENITPLEENVDGDTFTISYERAVTIDQVEVTTDISMSGQVSQTYRFSVATNQVEAFGEDLQNVFAPPENAGSIDTETDGDTTVYVASFDSADNRELNGRLEEYMPGLYVSVRGFEGIWPEYYVEVNAYGIQAFGVSPTQTLNLPPLHSANTNELHWINEDLTSEEPEYSLAASGPTLSGLITLGVIIVVVAVAIVLVIIFRKRIASGLRSAQQQAQTVAQSTSQTWQAASQQREGTTDAPATGASQAELMADDEAWQQEFSETKLH